MRFRIPNAPREVRLTQIPGAIRRLSLITLASLLLAALLGWAGRLAADLWVQERQFLARSEEVPAVVSAVRLSSEEGQPATVDVLYEYAGLQRTGSRIPLFDEHAKALRAGLPLPVLVDPATPDSPREARYARAQGRRFDWLPYGLSVGAALALFGIGREIRRTIRADLEPLRRGLLVWLTPDADLPETRKEIVFAASYYREDVKHPVRARIRPGRAPVRNGPKVLAVVVPSQPKWARVIDEDLAKTLGWWG